MSRTCSFCGQIGHNKATCEIREISMIFLQEETTRLCSYCNITGHDLRNCLAHQHLICFHPENEVIETPKSSSPPPPAESIKFHPTPKDLSAVKRNITFHTPLKTSDTTKTSHRAPRAPIQTNSARQVTQVIDFDIYDEPWVWAPPRPSNSKKPRYIFT